MVFDGEARTEIRRRPARGASGGAAFSFGLDEPVPGDPSARRSRILLRAVKGVLAALVVALLGYEVLAAPKDDVGAWTPPAGVTAAETPAWLQALCADRTRELCETANRARNPDDCPTLRATLHALEALERKLAARGAMSAKQRFVLTELYGQGHQLCQFERGTGPGAK